MTLGGRSILVIIWSHKNVTKRTFGTLTERSHMVLYWSYNNVPDMTLGGRSVLFYGHITVLQRKRSKTYLN